MEKDLQKSRRRLSAGCPIVRSTPTPLTILAAGQVQVALRLLKLPPSPELPFW